MAAIGGKLFSHNHKNMNHFHKDTKYLLYVIITMVTDIRGGDNVFYDGVEISDLVSRAHVLKHLYGRTIFGTFEKNYHEGTLWRRPRAVISLILTKLIFVHFYHCGDRFYNRYINKTIKTKYIDDDGSGVEPIFFHENRDKIFIWLLSNTANVG